MLRISNSKYLSKTSLFVQTPQGCSLPPFRRRYQYRNAEIHVGVVAISGLWSRPPCWHRSLSLVVYSCWPVLHVLCWIVSFNGHDVRWCCDELPIFHLAAFRKIYYICTFVHLHRVTKRLRINLYRNSTVKPIITCYTQVSTFNDWPIDLNHSYIQRTSCLRTYNKYI